MLTAQRATGQKNLARVRLDDEEIDPQDAAHEVVDSAGQYEWIGDRLGAGPEFAPQFANEDIVALRDARRALGPDMAYLGCSLPQLADFPNSKQLLHVHQDLSRFSVLSKGVEDGHVPPLADSSQETLAAALTLPRFHVHQNVGNVLMDGGRDGKERESVPNRP